MSLSGTASHPGCLVTLEDLRGFCRDKGQNFSNTKAALAKIVKSVDPTANIWDDILGLFKAMVERDRLEVFKPQAMTEVRQGTRGIALDPRVTLPASPHAIFPQVVLTPARHHRNAEAASFVPRPPGMLVGGWPHWMRAATAAAFCNERSVDTFLRRAGSIYPKAYKICRLGRVWLKSELEEAMNRAAGKAPAQDEGDDAHLFDAPKGGHDISHPENSKVVQLPTTGRRQRGT